MGRLSIVLAAVGVLALASPAVAPADDLVVLRGTTYGYDGCDDGGPHPQEFKVVVAKGPLGWSATVYWENGCFLVSSVWPGSASGGKVFALSGSWEHGFSGPDAGGFLHSGTIVIGPYGEGRDIPVWVDLWCCNEAQWLTVWATVADSGLA